MTCRTIFHPPAALNFPRLSECSDTNSSVHSPFAHTDAFPSTSPLQRRRRLVHCSSHSHITAVLLVDTTPNMPSQENICRIDALNPTSESPVQSLSRSRLPPAVNISVSDVIRDFQSLKWSTAPGFEGLS